MTDEERTDRITYDSSWIINSDHFWQKYYIEVMKEIQYMWKFRLRFFHYKNGHFLAFPRLKTLGKGGLIYDTSPIDQQVSKISQFEPFSKIAWDPPPHHYTKALWDICKTIFVILEVQFHHEGGLSGSRYLELFFSARPIFSPYQKSASTEAPFNLFWKLTMILAIFAF